MMTKFRMIRIAVDQFAILSNSYPENEISYSVGIGFKYAAEQRRIICVVGINFQSNNEKFLILAVSCEFIVDEESWSSFINESDSKLIIPKDFLEYLAVHTVGVTRGIMHCKTEGTPLNMIILPPINVRDIISEGIVDSLSDVQQEL